MSVLLVCIYSFWYPVEKSSDPLQSHKVATNELLISRQTSFRQQWLEVNNYVLVL